MNFFSKTGVNMIFIHPCFCQYDFYPPLHLSYCQQPHSPPADSPCGIDPGATWKGRNPSGLNERRRNLSGWERQNEIFFGWQIKICFRLSMINDNFLELWMAYWNIFQAVNDQLKYFSSCGWQTEIFFRLLMTNWDIFQAVENKLYNFLIIIACLEAPLLNCLQLHSRSVKEGVKFNLEDLKTAPYFVYFIIHHMHTYL